MDWEFISYFCENIFEDAERNEGTIIEEKVEDTGWGWYIFI